MVRCAWESGYLVSFFCDVLQIYLPLMSYLSIFSLSFVSIIWIFGTPARFGCGSKSRLEARVGWKSTTLGQDGEIGSADGLVYIEVRLHAARSKYHAGRCVRLVVGEAGFGCHVLCSNPMPGMACFYYRRLALGKYHRFREGGESKGSCVFAGRLYQSKEQTLYRKRRKLGVITSVLHTCTYLGKFELSYINQSCMD